MGGDGGHGLVRVLLGRLVLEPQEAVGEKSAGGQGLEDLGCRRAQVLGHDVGAGRPALAGDHIEKVAEGVAHVGAFPRPRPLGHPVQAGQPQGVVDAQGPGVAHARAHRLHEGLVADGPELPRVEGGQPPHLALRVERVGRRADGHARGEQVLPQPGVGAPRVEAHRQVVHERQMGRRRRQLLVEEPLEPLVVAHAVLVHGAEVGRLGAVGAPVGGRPPPPVGTVALGEGAVRGPVDEPLALVAAPLFEAGRSTGALPAALEGGSLEAKDGVAVDQAVLVAGPAGGGGGLEVGGPARHVLHAQVEGVAEAAAAREVGARLLGNGRCRRVQGVHEHEPGPELRRPTAQVRQVAEVADAPAACRARTVELCRPSPRRRAGGEQAGFGAGRLRSGVVRRHVAGRSHGLEDGGHRVAR